MSDTKEHDVVWIRGTIVNVYKKGEAGENYAIEIFGSEGQIIDLDAKYVRAFKSRSQEKRIWVQSEESS